ncbi:threonine aldolase family protein [Candidatus Galacturonibacter soehngenii]|uniref:Low specificity L-threonine aldolase n=1 Tax=Candidatus Galacturonatibacter soehngenii TaxID=2307010 RepID=A0A7V7QI75_9FIRM|nr:low specificity L-threonine aldolase [Candidatus Galacturonibacter soehngenii]KAB1435785.1 low specificity L-threonine aldolase [Candidatus Galacturonibacter soehngenii]
MYSFKNDYSEGAHPRIIEALTKTNMEQTVGYGLDEYCEKAKKRIQDIIGDKKADIHFFVGGTQTNQTAIAAFLKPYQAAVSADTGHINVHETGAIEATGHKVVTCRARDGKLTPVLIDKIIREHTDEHMVQPKLVYISNSTELGTVYNKEELTAISMYCKEHDLYLYMDGARLAAALASGKTDLTFCDIANLTDAFYIGGTKNGALFGEALAILNDTLKKDFRFMIKRQGGMLAKGRLLGIQFLELFTNDLYLELASHADQLSMKLKDGLIKKGYQFVSDSYTNMQFPIMSNETIKRLKKDFLFEEIESLDEENTVIRLVTSFATKEEAVEHFIKKL